MSDAYTMRVYGEVVGGDVGMGNSMIPHSGIVVCNSHIPVSTGVGAVVEGSAHPEVDNLPDTEAPQL